MHLKYHKAGFTPTTSVTSTAISSVKMAIGHKSLTNLRSEMIYHKAGLTPTTSVTSTAISSVKMAIGHKSLTNLRSEMIFLQGKLVFYIFLPSTPSY